MGVPGMFLWLSKINNNFIKNKLETTIDYLMLDLNCKIHPTCFRILKENPDITCIDKIELKMINAIITEIEELINMIKPLKGIYIAVDGVAPAAKIKQQRYRRFKTIADNKLWDNIKKKYNKPLNNFNWNNSAITPGTKFMQKLHNKLLEYIKSNSNIIYSSCYEPSEGEHKILQYIKLNIDNSYIIYGLDADLIFLSLASQSNKIYLLRETTFIEPTNITNDYKYINIELMKDYIYHIIQKKIIFILDKQKIINDFIFICYFLGNDFLPHLLSIDIYNNGIDYLLETYMKTIQNISYEYLINDNNINMIFFTEFIKLLSLNEDNILKYNYYNKKKIYTHNKAPYENELFKIENLLFKIEDPIKIGYDNSETKDNIIGWRERYYKYYWGVNTDELEDFSKSLVKHYLIGLKWITLYYFDKNPSWDWYFPFDFPPFINDIYKYLIDINTITFDIGEPLQPFMQLLSVLPPQSNYLLPKSLRKLMIDSKSSLTYLYPNEFEQCFLNKKKYWMGIPILPPLDIKLIKYIFNKYKDELTDDEINRNIYK